jgi:hypothetical protein
MSQPVSTLYYQLELRINPGDSSRPGTIPIDIYTFDPGLSKGDTIHVENWKVGHSSNMEVGNQEFEFDASVIEIQKIVVRHQSLIVKIIVESLDRETITQIIKALNTRNS